MAAGTDLKIIRAGCFWYIESRDKFAGTVHFLQFIVGFFFVVRCFEKQIFTDKEYNSYGYDSD